jgi:hypothetical protein
MGINSIAQIPQKIAKFLHLQNPQQYTGHCFRRSASTFLANQGISLLNLKRFKRWRSDSVAQRYEDKSEKNKREIATMVSNSVFNIQANVPTNSETANSNRTPSCQTTNQPYATICFNLNSSVD